jgi:xanthosine utilization system XapX-like protein
LGRRITLYVLSLQILVGIALVVVGLRAPTPHYALALVGWAGLMGANFLSRQPDSKQNVLVMTVLSSAMLLLAAYIGARAAGIA